MIIPERSQARQSHPTPQLFRPADIPLICRRAPNDDLDKSGADDLNEAFRIALTLHVNQAQALSNKGFGKFYSNVFDQVTDLLRTLEIEAAYISTEFQATSRVRHLLYQALKPSVDEMDIQRWNLVAPLESLENSLRAALITAELGMMGTEVKTGPKKDIFTPTLYRSLKFAYRGLFGRNPELMDKDERGERLINGPFALWTERMFACANSATDQALDDWPEEARSAVKKAASHSKTTIIEHMRKACSTA